MARDLIFLFSRRQLIELVFISFLVMCASLLEVIGIGLIFPYIAMLQDPERVLQISLVRTLYDWWGFKHTEAFIIATSIGLFIIISFRGAFGLAVQAKQLRFVYSQLSTLGERLLNSYLSGPYSFFLNSNPSILIGNLTTSLNQLCGGVLNSTLQLLAELVVILGLFFLLLVVNPIAALTVAAIGAGLGLVFIVFLKRSISKNAASNDIYWKSAIRTVSEAIGAVKEVQILGRNAYFVDTYINYMNLFTNAVSRYAVQSQLPRISFEIAAIGGVVAFVIFSLLSDVKAQDVVAVLSVYAIAVVRLMPGLNRLLQAWHSISFQRPAMSIIVSALRAAATEAQPQGETAPRMVFDRTIQITVQRFKYPESSVPQLRDINIEVVKGEKIALIGQSGSGKTTLVDLILGLHQQFDGIIAVDGQSITSNINGWRQNIGYIPQTIFLRDDTIARNIAFGIMDEHINRERLVEVLRLAGLESTVAKQTKGLETVVGDRGLRLSGGERQRIGIARALYHDPELLIMDEATSALDNEIEAEIMNSAMVMKKTIIIVAHRLTTVKRCDRVYLLKYGRIVDSGAFNAVAERNIIVGEAQTTLAGS